MTLIDRIWTAHPLGLTHRCVLLAIARQLPEGRTQIIINRTTLARDLETTGGLVSKALLAGEILGLCHVHKNGVVELLTAPLPGLIPEPSAPLVAVTAATESEMARTSPGVVRPRWVMDEFARRWEAKYKQRYQFRHGKDNALAKSVSEAMQAGTIVARITNYLSHPDPFYNQCAHAFGVFVGNINKFAGSTGHGDSEYERAEQRYQQRQAR